MGIIKEIFGKVRIYQLRSRVDSRGFMSYVFDENIYDFSIKEARIYSMPKEGTFFGIHYKEESSPMTKLVTVIKGKGSVGDAFPKTFPIAHCVGHVHRLELRQDIQSLMESASC